FTDEQFGGCDQFFQVPCGELVMDVAAGLAGGFGVLGQLPAGDVLGGGGMGAGDQQGGVVVGPALVGQQGGEQAVAQAVEAGDFAFRCGGEVPGEAGHAALHVA